MAEVTLTPRPVMLSTPMTIPAQRMIEAMVAICRAASIEAASRRRPQAARLSRPLRSATSRPAAAKVARAAANCGV